MFGGLELKGSKEKTEVVKENQFSSPKAADVSSGFSFLTNITNAASSSSTITKQPSSSQTPSSFSFLSSSEVQAISSPEIKEDTGNNNEVVGNNEGTPSATASGFSFLGGLNSSDSTETPIKSLEVSLDTSCGGGVGSSVSIFSMLATSISNVAPSLSPTSSKDEKPAAVINSTNQSSKLAWVDRTSAIGSSSSKTAASTKPPIVPSISSKSTNPTQPVGSGMIFGGAAKPRSSVIKKRRVKRVGLMAKQQQQSQVSSLPPPSVFEDERIKKDTTASTTSGEANDESQKKERESEPVEKELYRENLRRQAGIVSSKAERFMQEKKDEKVIHATANAYTGRYGANTGRMIIEDYGGGSRSGVDDDVEVSSSLEEDETYIQAKAAAEEALSMNGRGKSSSPAPSMGSNGSNKITGLLGGWLKRPQQRSSPTTIPNEIVSGGEDEEEEESPVKLAKAKVAPKTAVITVKRRGIKFAQDRVQDSQIKEDHEDTNPQRRLEELREQQDRKESHRLQKEEEERRSKKDKEEVWERKEEPAECLSSLLQIFSTKCENVTETIGEMRQERKGLLLQRSMAEKKECLAAQQIVQAELQQTNAAEMEDFDLADQLATAIDRHVKEKEKQTWLLEDIEVRLDNLDSRRLDSLKEISDCFVDVQRDLRCFLKLHENRAGIDGADTNSEIMERFEETSKYLSAEKERLAIDLKNIERDEGFVNEERTELEATISDDTTDFEKLRNEADLKLKNINDEIDELRKQLAAKLSEADKVRKEYTIHATAISHVRSKFTRQLTRLSRKENAIKESRSEWEAEQCSYENVKDAHEKGVATHSKAMVKHDKLLAKIMSEIDIAERLSKIITKEVVFDSGPSEVMGDNEDDLLVLRSEVVKCEAVVDDAKQILMTAKKDIETLHEEIWTIETRLPVLEEEKKASAAKRDFKAAGKASKEIKEGNARKESCKEQLDGEATKKENSAQEELEHCIKMLEESKSNAYEKEKESALMKMEMLVKKINRINHIKRKIYDGFDPNMVNKEEGYESVSVMGNSVLDGEIYALKHEGEELGAKFGSWETLFLNLYGREENELDYDVDEEDKADEVKEKEKSAVAVKNQDDVFVGCEKRKNKEENAEDVVLQKEECCNEQDNRHQAVERFQEITRELQKVEEKVEIALGKEDYDEAAVLDEKLQGLKIELESIILTEKELSLIFDGSEVSQSVEINDSSSGLDKSKAVEKAEHQDIVRDGDEGESSLPDEGTTHVAILERCLENKHAPDEENKNSTPEENAGHSSKSTERSYDIVDNNVNKQEEDLSDTKNEKSVDVLTDVST